MSDVCRTHQYKTGMYRSYIFNATFEKIWSEVIKLEPLVHLAVHTIPNNQFSICFNTTVSEICVTDPTENDICSVCAAVQSHMSKGMTAHLSDQLVWISSNKLYSSQAGHLPESDRFHHTTILKWDMDTLILLFYWRQVVRCWHKVLSFKFNPLLHLSHPISLLVGIHTHTQAHLHTQTWTSIQSDIV